MCGCVPRHTNMLFSREGWEPHSLHGAFPTERCHRAGPGGYRQISPFLSGCLVLCSRDGLTPYHRWALLRNAVFMCGERVLRGRVSREPG